jgi:hypothetical protein
MLRSRHEKIPFPGLPDHFTLIGVAGRIQDLRHVPDRYRGRQVAAPDFAVGLLFTYGKFRMVDLADLTWNREMELMCPNNPIGFVDHFMVSHHGNDISNSPALVDGLHWRVALMDTPGRGKWLKVSVDRNANITVTNGRTNVSKTYKK